MSALSVVGANAASLTVNGPQGTLTETNQSVSTPASNTCTLSAMADAYANESHGFIWDYRGNNYYNDNLLTDDSPIQRPFVRFDLSQNLTGTCSETGATLRSDASISSASLQFYVATGPSSSTTLDAYAVSAAWHERTLTYNNQPGTTGSATQATATTGSGYWVSFTVTSDVTGWWDGTDTTNYGWRVSVNGTGSVDFYSREDANGPRLVITYATGETTCTLTAADDTVVSKANPSSTFGTDTDLIVRPDYNYLGYQVRRGLVRFDLTSGSDNARCAETGAQVPPGATVRGASLRMFVDSNPPNSGDRVQELQRVSETWDENTVTWNSPTSGGPTVTGSVSNATVIEDVSYQEILWDVSSDVSSFWTGSATNYGWRIKEADESQVPCCVSPSTYYISSENGTAANRPKLFVHYTLSPLQSQQTCTLSAIGDTGTNDSSPNNNYGTSTSVWAGRSSVPNAANRMWVRFAIANSAEAACSETGLPVPPGSTINGASLQLYTSNAPSVLSFRAQPSAASWDESTLTWNNSPGVTSSEVAADSDVVNNTWVIWDVTTHVQAFYNGTISNYGWRIKVDDEGTTGIGIFATRENGTSANRPKLLISYSPDKSLSTCTLELPSADSYVSSTNTSTNYGTNTAVRVQASAAGEDQRTFVRFDLTPQGTDISGLCQETTKPLPADAYAQGAWLDLYDSTAPGSRRTLEAQRASASWTESGVTWANQPAVGGSASTAEASTTSNQHVLWNVTSDVNGFLDGTVSNYGWRLKDNDETASATVAGNSKESGASTSQRIRLRIQYWTGLSTCTLSPDMDSWVDSSSTSTNHGSDTNIYATPPYNSYPTRVWRGYLRTPVTGTCAEGGTIPASVVIRSAHVRLWEDWAPNTTSINFTAQRASASWTEAGITWANQPGVSGSAVQIASGATDSAWMTWDVTTDVRAFYDGAATNYGWRFAPNPETATGAADDPQARWPSREHATTGQRPVLVVRYDP